MSILDLRDEPIHHQTDAKRIDIVAQDRVRGRLINDLDDNAHQLKGLSLRHERTRFHRNDHLGFVSQRVLHFLKEAHERWRRRVLNNIPVERFQRLVCDVVLLDYDRLDDECENELLSRLLPENQLLDTLISRLFRGVCFLTFCVLLNEFLRLTLELIHQRLRELVPDQDCDCPLKVEHTLQIQQKVYQVVSKRHLILLFDLCFVLFDCLLI